MTRLTRWGIIYAHIPKKDLPDDFTPWPTLETSNPIFELPAGKIKPSDKIDDKGTKNYPILIEAYQGSEGSLTVGCEFLGTTVHSLTKYRNNTFYH